MPSLADMLGVDYFKQKGLIPGLAESADRAGQDIVDFTNTYMDVGTPLRQGSAAMGRVLFGADTDIWQGPQIPAPAPRTARSTATISQGVGIDVDKAQAPKPPVEQPSGPMGKLGQQMKFSGPVLAQPKTPAPAQPAPAAPAQTANAPTERPKPLVSKEYAPEERERFPNLAGGPEPEPAMATQAAAEEQKRRNMDGLIIALGEMGKAVMGPYQESWQAQMGQTAADLARGRVFSDAMEQALLGQTPDAAGLALLTPEQQATISSASLQQQQQTGQQEVAERAVGVEETRQGEQAAQFKETLKLQYDELNEQARQFNITQPIEELVKQAQTKYYSKYGEYLGAQADGSNGEGASDEAQSHALKYLQAWFTNQASLGEVVTEEDAIRHYLNGLALYSGDFTNFSFDAPEQQAGIDFNTLLDQGAIQPIR